MRVKHRGNYAARRREQYPPIGDQLDAIWKALGELRDQGYRLGSEAEALHEKVLAVKARIRSNKQA